MNSTGAATLLAVVLGVASLPLYAADPTANAPDPQSPDALSARLDYVDSLAKAEGGDCQSRLDEAQRQLEIARTSPTVEVALPKGLARVASVEYQIHFARASCGGSSASVREQELRAALEAAGRAVDLYRDAFDAVSMATMQFNTGVVHFTLGDEGAAIAALQKTIEMDREYGFEDDASDNYQLLLQWRHEEAGPDQVDALMKDFPQRSTTLAFGWSSGEATVSLESDYVQAAGGEILRMRNTRTAQRQIRKGLDSWIVSYQPGDAHYDLGNPPSEDPFVQGSAISLTELLLHFHDFKLSRDGSFYATERDFKFGRRLRADARDLGSRYCLNEQPCTAARASSRRVRQSRPLERPYRGPSCRGLQPRGRNLDRGNS
jgi:tetratricopeptide (TPR) repeat protein